MTAQTPNPHNVESELDKMVTIHFKENSIPGLRSGELTNEDKQRLLAWRDTHTQREIADARIDELTELESNGIGPDGFDGNNARRKRIAEINAGMKNV